nr:TetR/AcrR family transcriptional regulator C-terminal domain-containing protein [Eubacterium sp.]
MGLDARTRYSKKMIKDSFLKLLLEQPIKKITVTRICQLADINRATFYKYYDDPFDLLEKIEQEFIDEIKENLQHIEERDLQDTFVLLLEHVEKNRESFYAIAFQNGDSGFASRLLSTVYEGTTHLFQERFPNLTESQQKMLYYFLAHGFGGTLGYWIMNGMQESSTEVAAFLEKLILDFHINFVHSIATSHDTNA